MTTTTANCFLKQLKSQVCPDFEIYCYCLMTNHIHLLVKSNLLSHYMHHIAFVYAMWFNAKYHRKGYLFQDRFRSEGIETENYLIQCFRYILQNPVKAGICRQVSDYRWSSYRLYYNSSASFVNVGFIKNFFRIEYNLRNICWKGIKLRFWNIYPNVKCGTKGWGRCWKHYWEDEIYIP